MFKSVKHRGARSRRSVSSRNPARKRWRPRLELLEDRTVPATIIGGGGTPVYIADGWLYVLGSNGVNDNATVLDTNPLAANSAVLVTLNGQPYGFNEAAITKGIRFYGHNGNDYFWSSLAKQVQAWGGDGNDTINGSQAADKLKGQDGNDIINGWNGNDSIWGGDGNDTIDGGNNNDWITGQEGHDSISGGDGNDQLWGYIGSDTINGGDGHDTISGWEGNDRLLGQEGNDKIYGHAGYDWITGQEGNDWIEGGDDDDTLYGYTGNDTIKGGSGDDYISGWTGNDRLYGGGWDDEMHGGDGDDWMTGQSGNDELYGEDDDDQMWGYTGDDLLVGGNGNDSMSGWDGNDLLYGRDGNDSLTGGSGRDGLMGGNGDDYVHGGSDSDRYLTISDEDEIASMSSSDAVIRFGGPKVWAYSEIEMVDDGLARLHHRTGNTVLLKDPDIDYDASDPTNPRLTFLRDITDFDADGDPWGNVGENNGNGVITLYDSLFDPDAYHPYGLTARVAQYTIHEIGHSWDSESENDYELSGENVVDYFRTFYSDWRNDLGDGDPGDETTDDGQTYIKGGNANNDNSWWYLEGTAFVTDYAAVSPGEDFSDTLAVVVMGSQFYRNGNDTPDAPTGKLAWISSWLNIV